MTDYAALAAIEWPDDGYITRCSWLDPGAARLARIMRPRITPWPSIELFPRIAKVERFIDKWRYRITGAWQHLRGDDDYRY